MGFSNTFAYTETAQQFIFDACSQLGFLSDPQDGLEPGEEQLAIRRLNRLLKAEAATPFTGGSIKMYQRQRATLFLQPNTGTYVLTANAGYWANAFFQATAQGAGGRNLAGATTINVNSTTGMVATQNVGLQDDTGFINWTTISSVVNATQITVATGIANSMNNSSDQVYVVTDASSQPPQVIEAVSLRYADGSDVPVKQMTYEEWFGLPSKQQPGYVGDPIAIYYEPHLTGAPANSFGYLFTDVNGATDTTRTLFIGYIREIQDITNALDFLELPKEAYRFLNLQLAYDLADDFSVVWTPQKEAKRQEAIRQMQRSNPRRSTAFFKPGDKGGIWGMQDGFYSR